MAGPQRGALWVGTLGVSVCSASRRLVEADPSKWLSEPPTEQKPGAGLMSL